MNAKLPASEDPAGTDEDERGGSTPDRQEPPGTYGPLELLRMHKADGRALIVYSRQGESE
jgi:hypothetical protein